MGQNSPKKRDGFAESRKGRKRGGHRRNPDTEAPQEDRGVLWVGVGK